MENESTTSQGNANTLDMNIKASTIKTIVGALSSISKDGKLGFNNDGIKTALVDPSHVAMLNINIRKEAMEEYNIGGDFELALDFDKLSAILKLATGDEPVGIHYSSDGEDTRMLIEIDNIKRRMSLLDPQGMPDPKIPDLELNAEAKVRASSIMRAMRAVQSVTDNFNVIGTKDGTFNIHAEGDTDQVDLTLKKGVNEELVDFKTTGKTKSIFSLEFTELILKPALADTVLVIKWGTDQPIIYKYELEDGKVKFLCLLAPRIEEE